MEMTNTTYINALQAKIKKLESDNQQLRDYLDSLMTPKKVVITDNSVTSRGILITPCLTIEIVPKRADFNSFRIGCDNLEYRETVNMKRFNE